MFGFFFYHLYKSLSSLSRLSAQQRDIFFGVSIYVLLLGITSNVIEAIYPVLFLGMIFALPTRNGQDEKQALEPTAAAASAAKSLRLSTSGPKILTAGGVREA